MKDCEEMRVLSVSEFSSFCKEKQPSCYVYSTENQRTRYSTSQKLVLRFQNVFVSLKPDRICFTDGLNKMSFEGVKEVHMYDDRPSIGIVFKIICAEKDSDIGYTLIAD